MIKRHMEYILSISVVPNTRKTYATAVKSFTEFLDHWDLRSETFDRQLIMYITFLSISDRPKSPKTIATYVSGIRSEYKLIGQDVQNEFLIRRMIRGVKTFNRGERRVRLPILVQHLEPMLHSLSLFLGP